MRAGGLGRISLTSASTESDDTALQPVQLLVALAAVHPASKRSGLGRRRQNIRKGEGRGHLIDIAHACHRLHAHVAEPDLSLRSDTWTSMRLSPLAAGPVPQLRHMSR